jgi:2-polyprenyl-3-methyl-5-hydroxy-6-metoxy-1,4-benzoquinol methylase
MIDRERFGEEYRRSVSEVSRFITPERQEVIARHNLGLHPDHTNLRLYLDASERRYGKVVEAFNRQRPAVAPEEVGALDIGGFLGAFPLALARCGVQVTLVEEYDYYYGAFDDLKQFLEGEGIRVWAADFTQPLKQAPTRNYELITNMAMIEHLPSSPKVLLENMRAHMDERSVMFVEAPNVAYWPNRLKSLRGHSIHPALELMYESAPPFLGHHREYTVEELEQVLRWAGLNVVHSETFNYSLTLSSGSWLDRLYTLLVYLWPTLLFRSCRELILTASVLS